MKTRVDPIGWIGVLIILGVVGSVVYTYHWVLWLVAGLVLAVAIAVLLERRRKRRFLQSHGWYAGRRGRDGIYYQELTDSGIREIEMGGEMMTKGRHLIYLNLSGWDVSTPVWARERRDEIVNRIRSILTDDKYEYIET